MELNIKFVASPRSGGLNIDAVIVLLIPPNDMADGVLCGISRFM